MIEKNKFLKMSINFVLGILVLAIYFIFRDPEKIFMVLSGFSIFTFILILMTSSEPVSSPYSLFMIVLFVYNCGQVWLNLFGVPIIAGNYTITRYSDSLLAASLLFFLLIVLSINICFILKTNTKLRLRMDTMVDGREERASTNNNIIIIYVIVLFVCLLYDFGQYRIAASSGYAAALYARSDNELLYMCNCSFPFFAFLALRLNISKRQKIFVFITSALRYAMTTVLIGYRMQAISFVLSLIVLLYGIVDKKNKRKVTLLMIIGIFLAALLSIVAADMRRGQTSTGLWESYNVLIQELGGTFTDLSIIIRDIDEIGAVYGLSYMCSVLYLIPFIGHIIPGMSKYVNLSSILYTRITIYGNSSLGGSMLAEFFYNFKWGAIFILAPIVGILFAKISNAIKDEKSNPFRTAMLSYIFYIFLLYSRGNIGEVTIYIRCAVYIAVIHKFFSKKSF